MPGHPGLPCAMVLRLMARSPRGAMHYCPRRLADDRCTHPVGPHIPASLDAQTPGVRTTRFCRPRTSLPGHSKARACSPPEPKGDAVTAPCRSADRDGSQAQPALPSRHAPALPRPSHPGLRIVTIAKRPLTGRDGMRFSRNNNFGQSEYFAATSLDLNAVCFGRR